MGKLATDDSFTNFCEISWHGHAATTTPSVAVAVGGGAEPQHAAPIFGAASWHTPSAAAEFEQPRRPAAAADDDDDDDAAAATTSTDVVTTLGQVE